MNDALMLGLAFAAGLVLGAVFFGSLWWSVNRAMASRLPALWFLVGMPLRMAVALLGLYAVGRDHWQRLALCLVGFLIARSIATRLGCAGGKRPASAAQEARDAT